MQTVALTRKDLEGFAVCRVGLRSRDLWRMSTPFLAQLLKMQLSKKLDANELSKAIDRLEEGPPSAPPRFGNEHSQRPWIVYRTHNGMNYYLAVAELNEGDRGIHRRIRAACEFDFPFLMGHHG